MLLDTTFKFARATARLFLRWSDWWGDVAESIHTGVPRSIIRNMREGRTDGDKTEGN